MIFFSTSPNKRCPAHIVRMTAILGALFLIFFTLTIVSAHSGLDRSEPQDGEVLDQAPKEVVAWFSEELDSSQSMMLILDAQKQQVDNGDGGVDLDDLDHKSMIVSLRPSLPEGTYTVRWVAVSVEDGDSTEGEFTFSVGNSIQLEEPAKPSRSSASIWLYGGMALVLIFGGVIAASFIRRSWRGQ